jgi:hypothetical protein
MAEETPKRIWLARARQILPGRFAVTAVSHGDTCTLFGKCESKIDAMARWAKLAEEQEIDWIAI